MARNRMKQQANQHRYERTFQVGDMVFLRLQPYNQSYLLSPNNFPMVVVGGIVPPFSEREPL